MSQEGVYMWVCPYVIELLELLLTPPVSNQIAAIKVVAAQMACRVVDRAIQVSSMPPRTCPWATPRPLPHPQVHGALGVSQDSPLAHWFAGARSLRIADGPDIVHTETVAREELRQQAKL